MAISVDWGQKIVTVPKADTQLVQASPVEIRQLDLDQFRLDLNSLQDDEQGITYQTTHQHVPPTTVGGVTLARVVELINGYTVTFEDGQYAVNLVGANSNVGDVTNLNQVSIRSSNSAGLTFSQEINNQSFLGGAVWIDTIAGLTGTSFPRGTPTNPVLTFQDAMTIATQNKFNSFVLFGDLTLLVSDNLSSKGVSGFSQTSSSLTLSGGNTTDCKLVDLRVAGTANGVLFAEKCLLDNLTNFSGSVKSCRLEGTIVVDPSATTDTYLEDCHSDVPGTNRPTISMSGVTQDLQVRGYHGGMTLANVDQGVNVSIDMDVGTLEIASSCTAGTIVVRGGGSFIDNSGPGCTVISDGWLDPKNINTTAPKKRPGFAL